MNAVAAILLLLPIVFCTNTPSRDCSFNDGKCTYHVQLAQGQCKGTEDQKLLMSMLVEYKSEQAILKYKVNDQLNNVQRNVSIVFEEFTKMTLKEFTKTEIEHQQNIGKLHQNVSSTLNKMKTEISNINLNWSTTMHNITSRLQEHFTKCMTTENNMKAEISDIQENLSNMTKGLRHTENHLVNTEDKLNETVEKLNKTIDRLTHLLGQQNLFSQVLVNKISQAKKEATNDIDVLKENITRLADLVSMVKKDATNKSDLIKQTFSRHQISFILEILSNLSIITLGRHRHLPYVCDFDTDMCGITQSGEDDFDWTRRTGPAPDRGHSRSTGPSGDHTTTNGYYVYIEGDGHTPNKKAKLQIPVMSELGVKCLQFYYHMYARGPRANEMGTLSVYVTSYHITKPVWTKSGVQGDQWNKATVTLPRGIYAAGFEAITKNFWTTDIAIDDITIRKGSC